MSLSLDAACQAMGEAMLETVKRHSLCRRAQCDQGIAAPRVTSWRSEPVKDEATVWN
jgi:hypothetical protein